jgi:hypothetical protein
VSLLLVDFQFKLSDLLFHGCQLHLLVRRIASHGICLLSRTLLLILTVSDVTSEAAVLGAQILTLQIVILVLAQLLSALLA